MAARSKIKKCRKADPGACSDYYEAVSENKYKVCAAKQGGRKCGRKKAVTCPSPPPSLPPPSLPPPSPPPPETSCDAELAGRDAIGKCKNAPLSACSSFYEVLAHAH